MLRCCSVFCAPKPTLKEISTPSKEESRDVSVLFRDIKKDRENIPEIVITVIIFGFTSPSISRNLLIIRYRERRVWIWFNRIII